MLLAMLTTLSSQAGEATDTTEVPARPVTAVFAAEIGSTHLRDTYLSPITYQGVTVGLSFEHLQATGFAPEQWVRQLALGISYAPVKNPVGNNTMHELMVDGHWSLMHRWQLADNRLQLLCGGMTQLRAGGIYNAKNSNNVVSVKAHWNVGIAGMAAYHVPWPKAPLTLRWQVCVPVVGAFLSPEYDETYYEIYLGNRSNLVHVGWWGNRWDIDQLISADLQLGGTTLRVGYHHHVDHFEVSNIHSTIVSYALVIGIGGDYLTLSPRRKTPTKIVSPLF